MRLTLFCLALAALVSCARGSAPGAAGSETSPSTLSYEARQGQAVYHHYCETCHGASGGGDGFNAFNLDPRPRDLSAPDFQKAKTDQDLLDAVRRGGGGVGLSPLMPPWGHTLTPRQMDDVVLFLRSLKRKA